MPGNYLLSGGNYVNINAIMHGIKTATQIMIRRQTTSICISKVA